MSQLQQGALRRDRGVDVQRWVVPELPEVEAARVFLEEATRQRRIHQVFVEPDSIVLDGMEPTAVVAALQGATVRAIERWGKHLWWVLDRRPWPTFHLGMSGGFHGRNEREPQHHGLQLATGPSLQADTWPPRFTKLRVVFEDGAEIAWTNARRLGRLRLRDDPRNEPPIVGLGFDPLCDPPSPRALGSILARKRGAIKGVLLDQSVVAGVGNWVADEVLYAARIAPTRAGTSLNANDVTRLCEAIDTVVKTAVMCGADSTHYPASWLFHVRWRGPSPEATRSGVAFTTVVGRTTVWVPRVQG